MTILVQALSLVAVIGIGQGIKRLGWVSADDFPLFAALVLRITLPCALITSFDRFTIDTSLLALVAVGVGVNVVQQVTGTLMNRRSGHRAQAFGVLNVGTYNIGAFAIPYLAGFMGPEAVVLASLFDVGNAVAAAGLGYAWARSLASGRRPTPAGFARNVFSSVIFDVYVVLLVLRLLDLRLPEPVIVFTSTVGAANTFLAMLMIGIGLELRLAPHRYLAAARYLAVRYGWATVFVLVVWFLLPMDATVRTVVCMLLFAPVASMTPGFTSEIDGDVELSAFITSASIVVGLVMMPVLLLVLGG